MSWLFSRALVEASSGAISSGGELSAPSSSTTTPQAFSWLAKTTGASRRSRSGMTCERLTDDRGEAVLTWCLADSLARTSARQDREPASRAPAPVYGEKWRGSLAKYDRDSSSWRTPQCSLLAGLDAFSETWPRWGMMRGGECSGLATPERRISENESGLSEEWPTPRKCSAMAATITPESAWADRFPNLETVIGRRLWPTPTASDGRGGPGHAGEGGLNLRTAVSRFPTPTVNDSKNNPPSQELRNTPPLNVEVGGNMNPAWVEWLMGWPLGWTDLHVSATDRFRQWCASHGAASD